MYLLKNLCVMKYLSPNQDSYERKIIRHKIMALYKFTARAIYIHFNY